MPLRTDSLEEPSLNLTPMIDIVFLLIIFFMVGTQFSEIEQQFDIDPVVASQVAPMSSAPDPITVTVTRTGQILIGNQQLTRPELLQRLKAAQENYAQQVVLIRGDRETMYQSIMDVMDTCRQAQIRGISLPYKPIPGDSP
ncbi:MAG: biopolymer transporter ExbD [Planctomycetaceae bacterium]|jgi:biopolymer transport protein ExbD